MRIIADSGGKLIDLLVNASGDLLKMPLNHSHVMKSPRRIFSLFLLITAAFSTVEICGQNVLSTNEVTPYEAYSIMKNKYNFKEMANEYNETNIVQRSATIEEYIAATGIGLHRIEEEYAKRMNQMLEEIRSAHGEEAVKEMDLNKNNSIEFAEITIFKNKHNRAVAAKRHISYKKDHVRNAVLAVLDIGATDKDEEFLYDIIIQQPKEASKEIIKEIQKLKSGEPGEGVTDKTVNTISYLLKWLAYASSYEEDNIKYLRSAAKLDHWKDLKYGDDFSDDHLAGKAVEHLGYSKIKKSEELLEEIINNPQIYYQKSSYTTSVFTAYFHKYAMSVYGEKKYLIEYAYIESTKEFSDLHYYWQINSEKCKELVPWFNSFVGE